MYFYRLAVNKKSCSKLFRELHALSISVKRPKRGSLTRRFESASGEHWEMNTQRERERERESTNT